MTVHYSPRCIGIVLLGNTSEGQLALIKKELLQRQGEVQALWNEAQERADCTDQIDNDLDALYAALENILSDLEA